MAAYDPDLESEYARRRRVNRWTLVAAIGSSLLTGLRFAALALDTDTFHLAIGLTAPAFIILGLVILDRLEGAGPRTYLAALAFLMPPIVLALVCFAPSVVPVVGSGVSGATLYLFFEAIAFTFVFAVMSLWNAKPDTRIRRIDCMRCGYPLDAVAANRCPECGARRRAK